MVRATPTTKTKPTKAFNSKKAMLILVKSLERHKMCSKIKAIKIKDIAIQ